MRSAPTFPPVGVLPCLLLFAAIPGLPAQSPSTPFGERIPSNRVDPEPPPAEDPEPAPATPPAAEAAIDPETDALEKMHAAWLQTARKPLELLSSRYKAALEKYRDESQAAGRLDPTLAAKAALDALESGQVSAAAGDPVVENLRKVYQANLPAARTAAREASLRADRDYLTFLRKHVAKSTREGKIELARQTQAIADEVAARVERGVIVPAGGGEMEVVIVSAIYGHGEKSADVTAIVRKFVDSKKSFQVTPRDMGGDPNPYWHKGMTVKYIKNGIPREQQRGENEIVLPESFYGPQDARELEQSLADTLWKSDVRLEFKPGGKLHITGSLATGSWQVAGTPRDILLVWSAEKTTRCTFDYTWSSFTENSGDLRVFKKTK